MLRTARLDLMEGRLTQAEFEDRMTEIRKYVEAPRLLRAKHRAGRRCPDPRRTPVGFRRAAAAGHHGRRSEGAAPGEGSLAQEAGLTER